MKMLKGMIMCFFLIMTLINAGVCDLVALKIISDFDVERIRIKINNPYNEQLFSLNQEIDFSWILPLFYYTEENDNRMIEMINEGDIYEDEIKLDNGKVTIEKFRFVQASDSLQIITDYRIAGFGLCYKYSNVSFSLTHHLKALGYIQSLQYSLIFNTIIDHDYNNTLVFGGIPQSVVNESKEKGECIVIDGQSKWSCKLKEISFGGITYENHKEMYFEVGTKYIDAPKDFFNFLVDVIFKEDIEGSNCHLYDRLMIYCKCDVIDKYSMIAFTIDNYQYQFKASELFHKSSICNFLIYQNKYNDNTWRFGKTFIKFFNILFNYNASAIELYTNDSNRILPYNTTSNHHSIIILYISSSLLVILIIGIAIVSYMKIMMIKE